ncbi:hypothetical protein GCM10020219_016060 [Nonomuraea dietziae]
MNRRDALRMLGLSTLGATALAACAPDASGGGAPKGDTAAKTFGFTSWSLNEEAQKGAVQAIVDAYATAKQVKVHTASFPYNEYLNQVTLKLRGGTGVGRDPARTSPGSARWPPWASSGTSRPRPPRGVTPRWPAPAASSTASSSDCRGRRAPSA